MTSGRDEMFRGFINAGHALDRNGLADESLPQQGLYRGLLLND
jgi:hypothetical protein